MIPEKPHADLVVFPESTEVRAMLYRFPETQHLLFSEGIPRKCLDTLYSAAQEITIVEIPPLGRLLRFGGSSHFSDGLFIRPDTGEVVDIAQGRFRSFVNSSLEQFGHTVTAVMERFPFYSRSAEDENNDAAARDLSEIIRRIDPPAMLDNCFWSGFTDDVSIGDYATEDVLNQ
jgi:hypothetical protein